MRSVFTAHLSDNWQIQDAQQGHRERWLLESVGMAIILIVMVSKAVCVRANVAEVAWM